MRKKKPIRINESTLHKIIKESVKRVLRENESPAGQIFDEENRILRQYGLDPRLVDKLNSPDMIPYYNLDFEDDTDYTDDFGIIADEDGDIRIYISGSEYSEREDGWVVDEVKDMCKDLKDGVSVEDIWYDLSYRWSR